MAFGFDDDLDTKEYDGNATKHMVKNASTVNDAYKRMASDIVSSTTVMYTAMSKQSDAYFKGFTSNLVKAQDNYKKFINNISTGQNIEFDFNFNSSIAIKEINNIAMNARQAFSGTGTSVGNDFVDGFIKSTSALVNRASDVGKEVASNMTQSIKSEMISMKKDANVFIDNMQQKNKRDLEQLNAELDRQSDTRFKRFSETFGDIVSGRYDAENTVKKSQNDATKTYKRNVTDIKEVANTKIIDLSKEYDEKIKSASGNEAEIIKLLNEYKDQLKGIQDNTAEQLNKETNDYKTQTEINANMGRSVEVAKMIINVLQTVIEPAIKALNKGVGDYANWYESSYRSVVQGLGDGSRENANSAIREGRLEFSNGNVLGTGRRDMSYVEEYLPQYTKFITDGFDASTAATMATSTSITKILLPWYEQSVSSYENLERFYAGEKEYQLKAIKGMALQLKETEAGNRFVNSGMFGQLLEEYSSLLTNIEFNTGNGIEDLGDYSQMAMDMIANGMSAQDAYAKVKDIMSVDKDVYKAITSGDVTRVLLGTEIAMGNASNGAEATITSKGIEILSNQIANAPNDVSVGAMVANLGSYGDFYMSDWRNTASAKQANNLITNMRSNTNKYFGNNGNATEELQKMLSDLYDEQAENLPEYSTLTKQADNALGNISSTSPVISWLVEKVPYFQDYFSTVPKMLGGILAALGTNMLASTISKSLGGKGVVGKLLGKVATTSGKTAGILGNVTSVISKLTGTLGLITGGIMTIVDGVKGYNKADSWFAEENNGGKATATQKAASVIGSAIGGSGPGIFDKGADTGEVFKNIGTNALKGAALGMFAGPVGALVGGAIGAITGAVGGEKIAKGLNASFEWIGDKAKKAWTSVTDKVEEFGDYFKETKVGKFLSEEADVIKESFPKIRDTFSESVSDISNIWKDNTTSVFDKMLGSVVEIDLGIKKIIGTLLDSVKNTKIGKFVTGAVDKYNDMKQTVTNKTVEGIKTAGDWIVNLLGFESGLDNVSNIKKAIINKLTGLSNGNLPNKNRKGISNIFDDEMSVFVHKGEMILNAEDAEMFRTLRTMYGAKSTSEFLNMLTFQRKANDIYSALSSADVKQGALASIKVNGRLKDSVDALKMSDYINNMYNVLSVIKTEKDVYSALSSNNIKQGTLLASIIENNKGYNAQTAINMSNNVLSKQAIQSSISKIIAERDMYGALAVSNISKTNTAQSVTPDNIRQAVEVLVSAIRESSPNANVRMNSEYEKALLNLQSQQTIPAI